MEFLFQINHKILNSVQIDNYNCSYCHSKTKLNLIIKGGFLSIFLIPVLPIKKEYFLNCDNCQKTIKKNSLLHIEKEKVLNTFKNTKYKTPFLHYTGFFILMSILGFGIYTGIQVSKEEKIYIVNPKIGDVYRMNNNSVYTTLKANKVFKDSVYVFLNDKGADNYSGIDEINIDKNYNKLKAVSKQELKELFDKNTIYQIDRKE